MVDFARDCGTRDQYKNALKILLPDSPVYEFLEGRIQKPSYTFVRLAELSESDEREQINRNIGERRTRLGARLDQVTLEVTREVLRNSELEDLYQHVIDWTSDDEERRTYEEKLLQHAYDHLCALPAEEKRAKREKVLKLANGMVIIKHPYKLAWDVELEWQDFEDAAALDRNMLWHYAQFFRQAGLSAVLSGFFELKLESQDNDEDSSGAKRDPPGIPSSLSPEDRLDLLTVRNSLPRKIVLIADID